MCRRERPRKRLLIVKHSPDSRHDAVPKPIPAVASRRYQERMSMSQQLLNTRPLPLVAEEITAEWLTEVLQEHHAGVEVETAQVRDIINGTSTKIRVALTYNEKGRAMGLPDTMIVKGGFESHSEWMAGMYRDEVRFYRDVKPYLTINTPACYYAASDPTSHQPILMLEN